MAFVALFDSCVLYPAPLRDLLMHLAFGGLFRAQWTDEIHREWTEAVLRTRPELVERLARTRDQMNLAIPDATIEGYESLIPSLTLPDPDDRHVLAAAIVGRADVVVTYNLKHFPAAELAKYRIEAQHPDVFVRHAIDLNPPLALVAARAQRAALKSPPYAPAAFLDTLRRQQLTETVAFLSDWVELL